MRISINQRFVVPTNLSMLALKDGLILEVDASQGNVTIDLPPVNTYPSVEITVLDATGSAETSDIFINPASNEETIEGEDFFQLNSNFDAVTFKALPNNVWQSSKTGTFSNGKVTKELFVQMESSGGNLNYSMNGDWPATINDQGNGIFFINYPDIGSGKVFIQATPKRPMVRCSARVWDLQTIGVEFINTSDGTPATFFCDAYIHITKF